MSSEKQVEPQDFANVERVVAEACFPKSPTGEGKWWDYDVVQAEDYDRLLAAFTALQKNHTEAIEALARVREENAVLRDSFPDTDVLQSEVDKESKG